MQPRVARLRPSRSRSRHPSFPPGVVVVRAGPSRASHARSLMEGLKGTAIRLAVRDPAARGPRSWLELGGSGRGEGFLPRVAQATTTHTGTNSSFRAGRAACRSRPAPAGAGVRISPGGSRPCQEKRLPGTSRRHGGRSLPIKRVSSVPGSGKACIRPPWRARDPPVFIGAFPRWSGQGVIPDEQAPRS